VTAAVDRELRARARANDRAATEAAETGAADAKAGRPAEVPFGMDPDAYAAGYDTAKAERTKSPGTKSKAATSANKATGTNRRPAARRRARTAARRTMAPIERQAMNGATAIGTALALAVLYNVLANADAAAGVIAGAARVVKWLDSPTAIPYGGT
jgi:hypothetical protein